MSLPLYMLRRLSMPGGVRLRKLDKAPDNVAGLCPICTKAVLWAGLMGSRQLQGVYHRGDYYHYGDCSPYLEKNGYTSAPKSASETQAYRGNLDSEEYRFWIGYRATVSGAAICRACRTSVYSRTDRAAHFTDERFRIGGNQCTVRLVNAYKDMLDNFAYCIICKKARFGHHRWGVPICEQVSCENEWKFGTDRWLALEARLDKQKKEAGGIVPTPVGSVAFMVTKGETKARPWCVYCKMFALNPEHEQHHKDMILKGQLPEVEYM